MTRYNCHARPVADVVALYVGMIKSLNKTSFFVRPIRKPKAGGRARYG